MSMTMDYRCTHCHEAVEDSYFEAVTEDAVGNNHLPDRFVCPFCEQGTIISFEQALEVVGEMERFGHLEFIGVDLTNSQHYLNIWEMKGQSTFQDEILEQAKLSNLEDDYRY